MTKADVISRISEETGLTSEEVKAVVHSLFQTIIDAMIAGDSIEIRGFGSYSVKKRKPRVGRNPKTGVAVPLGTTYVPAFEFSRSVKDEVHSSAVERHGGETTAETEQSR
jgi:integration host factor beta subunit